MSIQTAEWAPGKSQGSKYPHLAAKIFAVPHIPSMTLPCLLQKNVGGGGMCFIVLLKDKVVHSQFIKEILDMLPSYLLIEITSQDDLVSSLNPFF